MRLPLLLLQLAAAAPTINATALDDYVSKPSPHFRWHDTGATIQTAFGGVAHVLNVTSQQWLDEERAQGPGGTGPIWTHQVVVVIPKVVQFRNVSFAYLTGGCNLPAPSVPKTTDEDLLVVDEVTWATGTIGIVVYQLPNCPIVYPSDPSHKKRTEDAVIAWGWKQYLELGARGDPEWLARLPMTKAAMAAMQAAQEYLKREGHGGPLAAQEASGSDAAGGWFVAGASKRGWTTWMVGAVSCPSCPNIVGIAPLVPIVPNMIAEVHRQWMAYGGWTFAFADYLAINLTVLIDSPRFAEAMAIVDPSTSHYRERLSRLPTQAVLSSDDEFMMMDWSNIWYRNQSAPDAREADLHLLIAQNSEHSLATGIPEVLPALSVFLHSIASGHTPEMRPQFEYEGPGRLDGRLAVTVPRARPPSKVVLFHAETLQSERRDFRWVRLANNVTGPCVLPGLPLQKPLFGGNCIQPIIWHSQTLTPQPPDTEAQEEEEAAAAVLRYEGVPPHPSVAGRWVGYYIELHFPSDTGMKEDYIVTTPGYTWPDTLPFKDCTGEGCLGHPL